MSEFEFLEGLEGAGDDGTHDAPDSLWSDAPTGADHDASYDDASSFQDAEWGPSHEDDPAEPLDVNEYEDPLAIEEPGGLLDGLEFDLSGLDLGSLSDSHFDASYDLIGSDPGEQGWWTDLVSDHNHDGAYETVSADDPYVAL
ncbi:hypothetical protein GCM10009557_01930 [Virgisporangium ochraceum]|jgi:hypothetical protein|uniref:Uncharacterized protein n=1 Tax=Virgisporangium ochraceum TaxID=65505 RepID=A0A8J3ZUI3_9ACTN|nr:hypothetical protein [Virgisporangium ochraceum]GIJ70154.1 hypothetical protein Voc01_050710 [Virgisporangium ochraceum]